MATLVLARAAAARGVSLSRLAAPTAAFAAAPVCSWDPVSSYSSPEATSVSPSASSSSDIWVELQVPSVAGCSKVWLHAQGRKAAPGRYRPSTGSMRTAERRETAREQLCFTTRSPASSAGDRSLWQPRVRRDQVSRPVPVGKVGWALGKGNAPVAPRYNDYRARYDGALPANTARPSTGRV